MKLANLLLLGGVACCGAFLYFVYRKPSESIDNNNKKSVKDRIDEGEVNFLENIEIKQVQGVLALEDVVAWFRNIPDLDQNVDTPFIAKEEEFSELLHRTSARNTGLFMGVYNDSLNVITHALIIEADGFDIKLKEILGNEPLVVLN